jgi:hypothetical protein
MVENPLEEIFKITLESTNLLGVYRRTRSTDAQNLARLCNNRGEPKLAKKILSGELTRLKEELNHCKREIQNIVKEQKKYNIFHPSRKSLLPNKIVEEPKKQTLKKTKKLKK